MLILTTNALDAGKKTSPVPAWPGLHVLVVLPGSGYNRSQIEALTDTYIIVEWLQNPTCSAPLLCDVIGWLEGRLHEDEGPLLYLDQSIDATIMPDDLNQIPLQTTQANFDPDGRIKQLVLGEMIATSPLLPGFLRMLMGHEVNDLLFIELLRESFVWEVT